MKKTIKFFAAALAIVAAASCAKENPNDGSQVSDQELVYKVFTASLNVDPDTKTTLVDGVNVHWTEGDKIKVLPVNSATGQDFELISYNSTFAEFGGEVIDAYSYRAVYPASLMFSQGTINSWYTESDYYVLGSTKTKAALAHQFAIENNFSIVEEFNAPSNFALSTSDKDGHLYFQNINAFLKLSLAMDNAASIEVSAAKVMNQSDPYDGGYQSLSEYAKLGGTITINFKNKSKKGILASTGEDITFKKEDGSNLKSGVNYYIAIPAVKIEGLKLVVKDANGKILQSFTKASTFTAEANKIYNLGTIEPAPVPVPKVGDYFYSDGTFSTELDKSNAPVGVIFYTGDPTEKDEALKRDYPNCTNGLVIALKPQNTVWHNSKLTASNYSSPLKFNSVPSASNWTWGGYTIRTMWEDTSTNLTLYSNCGAGPEGASEWYIPTPIEWTYILENLSTINEKISSASGTTISTSIYYWMPFLYASSARVCEIKDGGISYSTASWYYSSPNNVYPIFAF